MATVRPAAVAGYFYPGNASELDQTVKRLLAAVPGAADDQVPKAMIAPHAGYVYSGPVAATAYARLAPARERIKRVVLMGPAHRVAFRGLAVPSADAFVTPLGSVPVNREAIAKLLTLPQVTVSDEAHADEHSLEVHLPFLQAVLADFSIVPFVAGAAGVEEVAQALDLLWGGPETLIVISSDLSHYLDYRSARRIDAATTQAIERLRPADIGHDQACGRIPITGLLALAQRHGLVCRTMDVRNSGDTAGTKDRVVGYGSYLFFEPGPSERLRERHGETLLEVSKASITHGLRHGRALSVPAQEFAAELRENGACFITLKIGGKLRGCVGSPQAWRPLIEDVAENAFRAAFADSRFKPLAHEEWPQVDLSISVLTPPVPIPCTCESELVRAIRPNIDGVILADEQRRGLFLPAVWEALPDPAEFVRQLKRKAGLPPDHWGPNTRAFRFTALSI
ncbi:MAG TPA: AmmeMemoRadiSam system protein B [Alphaproteobacteria bacterium]|jgi:AmmeMemoRadiSam system protein B/AmmeMemoRadiSam system protein A|nr:AmmeMemoRadiSam system protein B [Alphaproteobacteria bacterium]